ncbi:MAG: hydroxyacylglutathione hydrolase [Blastocatellia bacterium]|jgi:glyoxylase-like metal-dependent hydrolase (beta-lactamase superfamily II)/rhodanese-related sulfurtransferase|nr:hydroxyacylglutathione hydrolase [Blastocatellia bacterium]
MYFKQFYLNCLAHASYLIGSDGEAAVVDPQRDVDQYLDEAAAQDLKIKYVIETHLHADFVSGHRELAARSGAQIIFGEQAGVTIPHRPVRSGEEVSMGRVRLRFLETPGHTPEGICVLVTDTEVSDQPQKILTGDTLFIGDVGRPDLAGGKGYTPQMMAGMMYDSLHEKLLRLDDAVEVFPAHGAGSMCGRNLSTETSSTIGEQRKLNYALQPMSKDEFIKLMTTDLPEAPDYFSRDAEINRSGAESLTGLPPAAPLTIAELSKLQAQGAVILDVRDAARFGAGHIPGSLNIGLGGQFASWAGSLIPIASPIVIVADSDEQVAEAQLRLARVGLENLQGYLNGGMKAWMEAGSETALVPQINVSELRDLLATRTDLQVIDVRRPPEFESGHAPRAASAPLTKLRELLPHLNLKPNAQTAVICAGGYRSSAASSILQQMGFKDLLNVTGGTRAWIEAGYEVEIPPQAG